MKDQWGPVSAYATFSLGTYAQLVGVSVLNLKMWAVGSCLWEEQCLPLHL